jgi:hypothetical protein
MRSDDCDSRRCAKPREARSRKVCLDAMSGNPPIDVHRVSEKLPMPEVSCAAVGQKLLPDQPMALHLFVQRATRQLQLMQHRLDIAPVAA